MSKKGGVPDAWDDDDWVSKPDTPTTAPEASNTGGKISKKERRAKQAELNRKLWEEAEAPKESYFVATRNEVPLKSAFKPAVKVLSRKPAPSVVVRTDRSNGLEKLTLDDEDDEDEEDLIKKPLTMEERQLKAQKEREEKQKKYEEVRQRLFGDADAASAPTSPGNVTPPNRSGGDSRNRGRSKGSRESRPPSSTDNKTRQLYDPNYTVKAESVYIQKRETQSSGSGRSTPSEEQLIRAPKGPDGSGRGGFGFANRGRGAT